nr:hypothetical protein [Tanacetum cinerariifolium]
STGLHMYIPGYEDPTLLSNETEFTLREVVALYELCKKLGRSIINDDLIHKVRMIFGFRSRKRTAAREPLQMKATISMPIVRCSGPGKLMIVTWKKNGGLYTAKPKTNGPADCQEAYWLEKSGKDRGLGARKEAEWIKEKDKGGLAGREGPFELRSDELKKVSPDSGVTKELAIKGLHIDPLLTVKECHNVKTICRGTVDPNDLIAFIN